MKNGSILSQSTMDPEQGVTAPVAPINELTPKIGVNRPDYKVIVNQLLYYYGDNCGLGSAKKAREFFKKNNQMLSPAMMELHYYIKQHEIFISSKLMEDLQLPEGTYYRYMKRLLKHGLIKKIGSIGNRRNKGVKGGPQVNIYAHYEYDPTKYPGDIAKLRDEYFKGITPGYQELKRLIPMVIEEYVDPIKREVNYRDILSKVKDEMPGYQPAPLADDIAWNLHKELKIKVWR